MFECVSDSCFSTPPPPCASLAATVAAMGNILFVAGTFLIIGPRRTSTYFLQKEKMRGTVCFALGFLMVIWGWAFFGLVIEVRPRASAASSVVSGESGARLLRVSCACLCALRKKGCAYDVIEEPLFFVGGWVLRISLRNPPLPLLRLCCIVVEPPPLLIPLAARRLCDATNPRADFRFLQPLWRLLSGGLLRSPQHAHRGPRLQHSHHQGGACLRGGWATLLRVCVELMISPSPPRSFSLRSCSTVSSGPVFRCRLGTRVSLHTIKRGKVERQETSDLLAFLNPRFKTPKPSPKKGPKSSVGSLEKTN